MGRRILGRYRTKFKRHASKILGIQNIKIGRAHPVGDKEPSRGRTIVAKLSGFFYNKGTYFYRSKDEENQRYSNL